MAVDQPLHSMHQESMQHHSQRVLEWNTFLGFLANEAHTSLGAERCRTLPLETELNAAQARQEETREMQILLQEPTPFQTLSFQDSRAVLLRTLKGATLEGSNFRDISAMLGQCHEAKTCLLAHRLQLPAVWNVGEALEELPWLKRAIDQCFDSEGHIRETATPQLHQMIQRAHELRRTMRHRLEAILTSSRYEDSLQGHYFAQRENRYVIPVKADMQQHIPGIVHDISGSGATVFLEPRELIDLNNSIKVADLHVAKEVGRILQDLSSMVSTHAPVLSNNLEVLADLDCLIAKARLSLRLKGSPIKLNNQKRIQLKLARHPLLILSKEQIIANDISMNEHTRVLVISGPNAGGKTVTLKLLGMFAFMVRVGLLPPCAEESDMAIFPKIYADIGDAQDLTRDLSSFSAHMTNIITLLEETSSNQGIRLPDSLVLLDEIGSSTDPAEGAALAEALLHRMYDLGLKVVVTTHYHSLKTLALRKDGMLNASHDFDIKTMSPTYRLLEGLPGGSSAINIAGRLGLDTKILDAALELMKGQERDLDLVFQNLHTTQCLLDQDLGQVKKREAEMERMYQEVQEYRNRIQSSELLERQKTRKQLQGEFSKAKVAIREILDTLQKDKTSLNTKVAQQSLAALGESIRPVLETPHILPFEQLQEGTLVEIGILATKGILLEKPQGKKRVKVRVGKKEMSVDVSLLRGLIHEGGQGTSKGTFDSNLSPKSRPTIRSKTVASTPTFLAFTLDVRGKTAEEAIEETIAAFDHALAKSASYVRVIHGHGSGKLKKVLRNYFLDSPYVESFKVGERADGGDGVTIVQLR